MARLFTIASSEYLTGSTYAHGTQYGIAAWILPATVTGNQVVASQRSTSAAARIQHQLDLNGADARLIVRADADGATTTATATGAASAGSWQLVSGVRDGSNLSVRVNAGTAGTATATFGGTFTTDAFNIGATVAGTSTRANFFGGRIAEVAIWDGYAPTLADLQALYSRAALPGDIARQYLVRWWRLWGNATERDMVGNVALTATGTARADHPPVPIKRRARAARVFLESTPATPPASGSFSGSFGGGFGSWRGLRAWGPPLGAGDGLY